MSTSAKAPPKSTACPLKPSDRPCLTVEADGSIKSHPDHIECWQTGNWCAAAVDRAPMGTTPRIPERYRRQKQIRDNGLLPHDIDSEESVLGSCLIDPEAETGTLQPADFYRERNGWIFGAILALRNRGVGVNQVTVAFELKEEGKLVDVGGPAYLSYMISQVPTPFHCQYFADIVRTCADRRRAIGEAGRMAGKAYEGGETWRKQRESKPAIYERADSGIDGLL